MKKGYTVDLVRIQNALTPVMLQLDLALSDLTKQTDEAV